MKRGIITLLAVVMLATAAVFAAACGDDDQPAASHDMSQMMGSGGMMNPTAPAGAITVDLLNWSVTPAATSARAGEVTFFAVHAMAHQHGAAEGGITHDLQIMKKNADGSMDLVGQVQGLAMGEAKAITVNLTPGAYELSCNVVEVINGKTIGHYQLGMHTAFNVTA